MKSPMSFSGDDMLETDVLLNKCRTILASGLLEEEDSAVSVYDFGVLEDKIARVKSAFPASWIHTVAVKANPLSAVLNHIAHQHMGFECASFEEVMLSNRTNAGTLVWDSPVKTDLEIQKACALGRPLIINANGLDELILLLKRTDTQQEHIRIGLRINPQMSLSSYASMSVGGEHSKFGEPISNAENIKKFLIESRKKIGIHVHASSQNLDIQETVEAIARIYNFALEIGFEHLDYIDIGGGFPVNYGVITPPSMAFYAERLKHACPNLFDGSVDVITEFGRYYHANAGFNVSRVHEVKNFDNHQVIIQHLGADMFLRESYEPGNWFHRMALLDSESKHRKSSNILTDVGGPLCFGGDYIAKNTHLPQANAGDYLVVMDSGANSYALCQNIAAERYLK